METSETPSIGRQRRYFVRYPSSDDISSPQQGLSARGRYTVVSVQHTRDEIHSDLSSGQAEVEEEEMLMSEEEIYYEAEDDEDDDIDEPPPVLEAFPSTSSGVDVSLQGTDSQSDVEDVDEGIVDNVPQKAVREKKKLSFCFYCGHYVTTAVKLISCIDRVRHGIFYAFAAGNEKVAARMEQQYVKSVSNLVYCKRHIGPQKKTIIFDRRAIKEWTRRTEDDEQGKMMTLECAEERYGYKMSSHLQNQKYLLCIYCGERPWFATRLPSSEIPGRSRVDWLRQLSGGHKAVEDLLHRRIVRRESTQVLCGNHFLCSSFYFAYGAVSGRCNELKIHNSELPVPDFEVIARLLKEAEAESTEPTGIALSGSGSGSANDALSAIVTGTDNHAAVEDEPLCIKLPEMRRSKINPNTGTRLSGPLWILDWFVSVDGNSSEDAGNGNQVIQHRFIGKSAYSLKCLACGYVHKEVSDVYLQNVKKWNEVNRRRFASIGVRSPYAQWLSDNKDWLRTQFEFKVHEFSAKAKLIWNELSDEVRAPYLETFREQRAQRDANKAAALKLAEENEGVKPSLYGTPIASFEVVNGFAMTDIDRLEHICIRAGRPFSQSNLDENGKYVSKPLDLPLYEPNMDELRQFEESLAKANLERQKEDGPARKKGRKRKAATDQTDEHEPVEG